MRSVEATAIYRSARLLHVAFAAQREIAHLLRLYDDDVVPKQPVEILITRNPPWPEPDPSDYIPGSPDDPNYQGDGDGDRNDSDANDDATRDGDHPSDEQSDDEPDDEYYARVGLPPELRPNGMDSWRALHGYPPRPLPGGPLDPTPASRQLGSSSPRGHTMALAAAGSPSPVGHPSARTDRDEEQCIALRSQGQSGAGDRAMRSETPETKNPATPATAPTTQAVVNPPEEIASSTATTPATAPPTTEPPGSDAERPDYPIAWLFPPGAPIPRPYRNAPPRPDRAFWNNPIRR